MLPEERDRALILDIISAGEDILSFIEGCDFQQFSESKLLRYAVERQLLVIGEAARTGFRIVSGTAFRESPGKP